MSSHRAQLSLSVVEAAIGVVLILGVAAGFGVVTPPADTELRQLDDYADDAVTALSTEPASSGDATLLVELARSEAALERERDVATSLVDGLFPASVGVQIRTPVGSAGVRPPPDVPSQQETVPTRFGRVTVRVWYG